MARQVLDELDGLQDAARLAERWDAAHRDPDDEGGSTEPRIAVQGEGPGRQVVISPGSEIAMLCLVLEVFANAVLDPTSDAHRDARGALRYAAAAWSQEIGRATGATE